MAQVLEFRLPDLGEGLTEAGIVRWLVEVGEVVEIDQPVVEVETAKALVEVPCPYGGVVTARFGEEGTELPVGAPLITVAVGASPDAPEGGEQLSADTDRERSGTREEGNRSAAPEAAAAQGPTTAAGSHDTESSGNVLVGYGTGAAPARRRRVRPSDRPGTAGTSGPAEPSASDAGAGVGAGVGAHAGPVRGGPAEAPEAVGPSEAGIRDRGTGRDPDVGRDSVDRDRAGDEGPVPVISPLVRRLARESGVDLRQLTGSGHDGLILRSDVEQAIREEAGGREEAEGGQGTGERQEAGAGTGTAASAPAATGVPDPGAIEGAAEAGATHAVSRPQEAPAGIVGSTRQRLGAGTGAAAQLGRGEQRLPLRGVRGIVADKMTRSRREIPDATCWVDADATELLNARRAMNANNGPKISLLALLARICTAALVRYPELNATVDTEAREIVRIQGVHIGFAAQTDRGLVVPVVRDAHARGAESLSAELARLTEAAHEGKLTPAELTGGTFTLNNYGVFGVDGSTPIINHPEAAMLGVGRIVPKPWVHEGELAVRQVVQLSLTFDHRVCDGGVAGGFLRHVADCVEQPAVLLRTV